jgi:serine/threonine-protein kinase RsbW
MELIYTLCLPRDEASVPFVRHLCRATLRDLGVSRSCVDDIEVAVSEACSNVLRHAAGDGEYEVGVRIDDTTCTLEIKDNGGGFDSPNQTQDWLLTIPESGRGIHLMKALVDELKFSTMSHGTAVTLKKVLELEPKSLLGTAAEPGRET